MSSPIESAHTTVLLAEVLDALQPSPGRGFRALDATLGGAGHSFGLLERSTPDGVLIGLDADPAAIQVAEQRLAPFAGRFTLRHGNSGVLRNTVGSLDAAGRAVAQLTLPPLPPLLRGLVATHVVVALRGSSVAFVSNPVTVTLR